MFVRVPFFPNSTLLGPTFFPIPGNVCTGTLFYDLDHFFEVSKASRDQHRECWTQQGADHEKADPYQHLKRDVGPEGLFFTPKWTRSNIRRRKNATCSSLEGPRKCVFAPRMLDRHFAKCLKKAYPYKHLREADPYQLPKVVSCA